MVKPGTMINVKKGLGVALAILSINYFCPMSFINSLQIFHIPIMIASSYFLIKSGARQ